MEPADDQKTRVNEDLSHITRSLTSEDLNPEEMFSKKRGIRACTPPIRETPADGGSVAERLKRVRLPK
jgi:hypothetical protein